MSCKLAAARVAKLGRVIVALVLALVLGCGRGGGPGGSRADATRGIAKVGGQVVSTVDGYPISVAEVQGLVKAGLSPGEALRRLQAERLLMQEAGRRGLEGDHAVKEVARQARVQALLEAEAASVVITPEDVREAYAKQQTRFAMPARRGSVHVLAKLPRNATPAADAAARDFVAQILPELAAASDLPAFLAKQRGRSMPQFSVVSEQLPPITADSAFVKPYLEAVFSLQAPGVVAQPVRTIYGWHAIRVTEILAAETIPYDKAEQTLRAELLLSRRQERVQRLIEKLRADYGVQIPDNVGQILARVEL